MTARPSKKSTHVKSIFARSLFASFALLAGTGAFAGPSMLRIACEGEDVRAEVEINGKFRGECPLDIQVPAGTVQLAVRKKAGAEKERLFTDEFRIGDDTIKKVEVRLGASQWNAKTLAAIRKGAEQGVPCHVQAWLSLHGRNIMALRFLKNCAPS